MIVCSVNSPAVFRLQTLLTRNGQPRHRFDPQRNARQCPFAMHYDLGPQEALVMGPNGQSLHGPSNQELAGVLGLIDASDRETI